jgi:hypothetical protein
MMGALVSRSARKAIDSGGGIDSRGQLDGRKRELVCPFRGFEHRRDAVVVRRRLHTDEIAERVFGLDEHALALDRERARERVLLAISHQRHRRRGRDAALRRKSPLEAAAWMREPRDELVRRVAGFAHAVHRLVGAARAEAHLVGNAGEEPHLTDSLARTHAQDAGEPCARAVRDEPVDQRRFHRPAS